MSIQPATPVSIAPIAVRPTEAMRLIGISKSGLYALTAAGEIPTLKMGGKTVIKYADLVKFIDGLSPAPANAATAAAAE